LLEKPPPSDWLALTSSNWNASVEKASDGDTVLIMPDQWRELIQETEMSDSAGVKASQRKQNPTCFDPIGLGSHKFMNSEDYEWYCAILKRNLKRIVNTVLRESMLTLLPSPSCGPSSLDRESVFYSIVSRKLYAWSLGLYHFGNIQERFDGFI
jgi:hypothetical protein